MNHLTALRIGTAVFALLVLSACSRSGSEQDLLTAVPSLQPDVARHLVQDDESRFETYARDEGARSLELLEREIWRASLEPHTTKSFQLVCRSLERVTESRRRIFGIDGATESVSWTRAATPEERVGVALLVAERDSLILDNDRVAEVGARLDSIASRFDALGLTGEAAYTAVKRAEMMRESPAKARSLALRALGLARKSRRPELICDALLHLSNGCRVHGPIDSLHVCMREATDLALEHRLPVRLGLLAYTYSQHFQSQGRVGLAAELREQGVQGGYDFHGGIEQIPTLERAMSIHADFGELALVARDLERADEVLKDAPEGCDMSAVEDVLPSIELHRATILVSEGRLDESDAIYKTFPPSPLVSRWSRQLLQSRHPERALEVLKSVSPSDESVKPVAGRLFAQEADAYLQLGRIAEAESTLVRLQGALTFPRDPWLPFEAYLLEARLACAKGNWGEVDRRLDLAGDLLVALTASDLTGAQLYVTRRRTAALRRHRRLLARPGLEPAYHAAFDDSTVVAALRAWIRDTDGTHLLYEELDDLVLRWTADRSGLTCDTLSVTPSELRSRVRDAQSLLASDPGTVDAAVPDPLKDRLSALAELLLPDALARSSGPLLVSVTGALRLLPFEALPIRSSDYVPILMRHEIGYLRLERDVAYPNAERSASSRWESDDPPPGVIIARPQFPPEMRRRYGGLADLDGGEREAQHLRELSPDADVLEGEDACLGRIFASWEGPPFLYFATHVVRDPENPFWTFLPVAASPEARLSESRLEVIDILRARLRSTRVVVLSGCASGAPHVAAGTVSPGLADAFLDAGAAKVVQTFWDVHDQESTELMIRFQDAWLRDGLDPVGALAKARRERFESGVEHPFYWSAYAVQMTAP